MVSSLIEFPEPTIRGLGLGLSYNVLSQETPPSIDTALSPTEAWYFTNPLLPHNNFMVCFYLPQ